MINRLTVLELKNICKNHKYIMVTYTDGFKSAINTKCAPIALKRKKYKYDDLTRIISYRPCSFMEYISNKQKY